jgi:hypothetical protein
LLVGAIQLKPHGKNISNTKYIIFFSVSAFLP